MQGFDGTALISALNAKVAESMQAVLADMHARLLGYEIAIVALIGALGNAGALPIASAKSALDAAVAGLSDEADPGVRAALLQLSARLDVPVPGPSRRH